LWQGDGQRKWGSRAVHDENMFFLEKGETPVPLLGWTPSVN
jgi:hypothetical protein